MAGEIVIGTRLDNKKFQQQLERLEHKLENQELNLEITEVDYDKEKTKLEELNSELEKHKNKQKEIDDQIAEQNRIIEENYTLMADGSRKITGDAEAYNKAMEQKWQLTNQWLNIQHEDIDRITPEWEKQQAVVDKLGLKIEKQKNDINATKGEVLDVYNEAKKLNEIDLDKKFQSLEKSIAGVGKKMFKVGLSMLGIQTAMGMFRQSFNRVVKKHPEMQKAIEKIKAMVDVLVEEVVKHIEPLLPMLIPLLAQILTIIFQIVEVIGRINWKPILEAISWILTAVELLIGSILRLFGLDISKETNKFKNNLKDAKGEAKELKKQLMGFDEMNILNDDGSTGALGSLGTLTKGVDVQVNFPESEFTKKIDELKHYWDVTFGENSEIFEHNEEMGWSPTTAQVIADKALFLERAELERTYGEYFGDYQDMVNNWQKEFKDGKVFMIDPKTNESIELTMVNYQKLVELVQSKEFHTWQEDMLKDVTKQLKKLKSIKVSNELKKTVNNVVKISNELNNTSTDFKKFSDYLQTGARMNEDYFGSFENGMWVIRTTTGETFKITQEQLDLLQKQILNNNNTNVKEVNNTINAVKGIVGNGLQYVSNSVNNENKGIGNIIANGASDILSNVLGVTGKTNTETNATTNNVKNQSKQAVQTIKDETKGLPDWLDKNVITPINKLLKPSGSTVGENIGQGVKDGLNKVIDSIEKNLQQNFSKLSKNSVWGAVLSPLIKLPRLAKGGIINQPGRGVYVGGAVAGERGREGVIPLTDSQQMALLGREIAKNIVINLNNRIDVDGKELARYTSKVMNDINFASNGGVI